MIWDSEGRGIGDLKDQLLSFFFSTCFHVFVVCSVKLYRFHKTLKAGVEILLSQHGV